MKKHILAAILFAAVATPAFAEEATPAAPVASAEAATAAVSAINVAPGDLVFSTSGQLIGRTYTIMPDGSPRVIFRERFVVVPLATLSRDGARLVTSLTRAEVSAIR